MISPETISSDLFQFQLPVIDFPSLRFAPRPKRFYVFFRPPLWMNKRDGRVMVMVEAVDDTAAIDVAVSSGVYTYVEPDYGGTAFVLDGVEPA